MVADQVRTSCLHRLAIEPGADEQVIATEEGIALGGEPVPVDPARGSEARMEARCCLVHRADGDVTWHHPRQRPLDPFECCVVVEHQAPGHLPISVSGGPVAGGVVQVAGDASSQFLSGLLLAGPAFPAGLRVEVTTPLVSEAYVALTLDVLGWFGAEVVREDEQTFVVASRR